MNFTVGLSVLIITCIGCIAFIWNLYKTAQLDRALLAFLLIGLSVTVIGMASYVRKAYVKESIEDECWAYLKGRVYCRACNVHHPIASIYAKQVWAKGTSDQGWNAYVFAERFKDGSSHDPFGFDLTLHNHKVVRMKYDPTIHPITGE